VVDGKNNRSCWHKPARPRILGSTRGALPGLGGCGRHDSHHCAWCWPRPSSIPKANHRPIRQRWAGAKYYSCTKPRRGVPQGTLRGQMYIAIFRRKTVRTTGEGRKTVFSVVKTQAVGTRSRSSAWSGKSDKPSFSDSSTNLYRLRHRSTRRACQQSHLKSFCNLQLRKKGGIHPPVWTQYLLAGQFGRWRVKPWR